MMDKPVALYEMNVFIAGILLQDANLWFPTKIQFPPSISEIFTKLRPDIASEFRIQGHVYDVRGLYIEMGGIGRGLEIEIGGMIGTNDVETYILQWATQCVNTTLHQLRTFMEPSYEYTKGLDAHLWLWECISLYRKEVDLFLGIAPYSHNPNWKSTPAYRGKLLFDIKDLINCWNSFDQCKDYQTCVNLCVREARGAANIQTFKKLYILVNLSDVVAGLVILRESEENTR